MTTSVHVNLDGGGYDIRIAPGTRARTDWPSSERVLIVSDSNVDPLHGDRTEQLYADAGLKVQRVVVPAGEPSKALAQVHALYDAALAFGMDRTSIAVALGGGVVGDLCGFFAASYLRGIRYVQIPTSLLAMVDSSVGGKTGVNLPQGKNLIGAFYQPIEVVVDLDTLRTLPPREYASGLAEIVKYGVLWDAELFRALEDNVDAILACDLGVMAGIVARCCEIKSEVVALDEREGGLRAVLNFGHTYAHALEKVSAYGSLLHGEAVSIGMVYAAMLSVAHSDLPAGDVARIRTLLERFGLPVAAPAPLAWDALREAMSVDKKTLHGIPRFVLAKQIGQVVMGCEVDEDLLKQTHADLRKVE